MTKNVNVFYVESVCNDPEIIKHNIQEVKLHGPDYKEQAGETEALDDFLKRIKHYEDSYEPLDENTDSGKSMT